MQPKTGGAAHIAAAFQKVARQPGGRSHGAEQARRAALMPYFTLGFPTLAQSVEIVCAIAQAGADLIELGVPFSDPLADGPTIQRSTQIALEQGASLARCLELTRQIRTRGVQQPLILMGYYNPILAYGVERFAAQAVQAGADGFIVPDLPLEEAEELQAACQRHRLALIYLAAPTSTPERLLALAQRTSGFLYLVSLTGVTGARQALPPGLEPFITRVRALARTPIAVGFGVSTPEQARLVGQAADGVIVGSALIQAVENSAQPVQAAAEFVQRLRNALQT